MNKLNKLNKAEAENLFRENAILIGSADVIPEHEAIEILGEESVGYAQYLGRNQKGRFCNAYGIGSYSALYLTLEGFMCAVTYRNIRILEEEAKAAAEAENDEK